MAEFNLWLLILGIAAGAAVVWLAVGTIARSDDEVAAPERKAEAEWIARTIDEHGGRAPTLLVEQILGLHRRYLRGGSVMPVPVSPEAALDAADEAPDAAEEAPGFVKGAPIDAALAAEPVGAATDGPVDAPATEPAAPQASRRRSKAPSGRSRAAGRAAGQ